MNDLKVLKKLNLLYVEDNKTIIEGYLPTFELLFQTVFIATNYNEALEKYTSHKIDLIIVDIHLGKLSGLDLAKKIRNHSIDIPIVFLTAYNEIEYLLEAANLQIDGYIIKPLDIIKLQNSMEKCLKKIQTKTICSIGDAFFYNISTNELLDNNEQLIPLGKKENQLLAYLIHNKDRIVSKDEIEYNIWELESPTENALKSLIFSLRKKIGKHRIINITGLGWKLDTTH